MKKNVLILLCLILLFSLVGCSASSEKKVMNYYDKHISELKDNVGCHFEKGEYLSSPSRGVTVNEWDGEHIIVEYIVSKTGLAPSSQYCGFFYSQDDVPVSFQNSGEEMISISETEWEWNGESNNHGFVRQIEPYWFYFEANF